MPLRDGHANLVKEFAMDVTVDFCKRNRLSMIIRSHQARFTGDGYEVMHGGRLMRVFSARDYDEKDNDGSILVVERVPEQKCYLVRPQEVQRQLRHPVTACAQRLLI